MGEVPRVFLDGYAFRGVVLRDPGTMLLRLHRIIVSSASLACCRFLGGITLHRIRHFLHHLLGVAGARREGRGIKFRSIPSCAIAAFDSGRRVCLQVALRRYTVLYWCAYPMRGLLIPYSATCLIRKRNSRKRI